ncbi:MAG: alkyl hydroperoxide reductase [Chloroflexi bacterium]|jgi:alkyl hydroperoxide reductase subunit AhpC|nr:alkyl hydroperoxide reductase [Chloroflexota bacterium]
MNQSEPRARQRDARGQPSRRAAQRAREQRRRRFQWLLIAATVLIVAVVGGLVASQATSSSSSVPGLTTPQALSPASALLPVGSKAPDFNLATTNGQHYQLSAQQGHVVLLEYFAVWCPVCQAEAPTMAQIDQHFQSLGLKSFSILSNPYGRYYESKGDMRPVNSGDVSWFKQTFAVNNPILIDPNFTNVNRAGVSSYPTIYVIDSHGIIRYASSGQVPYSQLASAINAAGLKG